MERTGARSSAESEKPTVLIVDDEWVNIAMLAEGLSSGFHVKAVKSAPEAMIAVAAVQPDLVLLDINMPETDGYELCSLLRRDELTRDIPIIFITGRDRSEDEARGLALGAVDYITKPFHMDIVVSRVKTQVELKRQRDRLGQERSALRVLTDLSLQLLEPQAEDAIARATLAALVPDVACAGAVTLTEGTTSLIPSANLEEVAAGTKEEASRRTLGDLQALRSALADPKVPLPPSFCARFVVPIGIAGRSAGQMVLVSTKEDAFEESGRGLVEAIALRASLAIEHSRLHREAARAIRARDDILAIVSHDLLNPVNAIELNAQTILADPTPGSAVKRASAIRRATRTMVTIIGDLLDASAIDAGKLSIAREPRAILECLTATVEVVQAVAAEKGIALELAVESELPLVLCDEVRIRQAVHNLLGNAIKFTPSGGRIVVSAFADPSGVRVRISDTGHGIGAEDLPRLFDRYWRAPNSPGKGTGLGLFIVREIVRAHGAEVEVTSTLGQGTTMEFVLSTARAS